MNNCDMYLDYDTRSNYSFAKYINDFLFAQTSYIAKRNFFSNYTLLPL